MRTRTLVSGVCVYYCSAYYKAVRGGGESDRVARQKPSDVSETKTGDGKGSPLYRLNMWYMRWGDTKQAMQMVRRFAKKDIC